MKKNMIVLLAALLMVTLLPVRAAAVDTNALEPAVLYKNDAPASVDTVEEKVEWIAEQCRATGLTDEWEIALWLHNWIIYNAEYDYTHAVSSYNAEGILLKGTAVCTGYAEAYKALLDAFNIENMLLNSTEMSHMWNLVKLNGEWCHVDCTWDDPNIAGDEHRDLELERVTYFGADDELMRLDHTWDPEAQYPAWGINGYPACTSKDNYYYRQTTCGPNATWSFDKETGTLTISGTGDITRTPWAYVGRAHSTGQFVMVENIRRVVIEPGITGIVRRAFENSQLTDVTIPDTVTWIGNLAFGNSFGLEKVYYGGSSAQWRTISVGKKNEALLNAEICFLGNIAVADADGDGALTTNDAVYLLLHVMFGAEDYPLSVASADFDGDGAKTTNDAVYLLLHVMFGEADYPLAV